MRGSPTSINYKGQTIGKLYVVEGCGERLGKWLCKCSCGKEIILYAGDLMFRKTCGCLRGKQMFKHGMWKTTFYKKYGSIKRRCQDPKDIGYPNYGGKGIKFLWKSFEDFRDDMHASYLAHKKNNKTTSIERINNNGNYCKENCRWATIQEQARNRKTNRFLTYNGRTQVATDWARELGITPASFFGRLRRLKTMEKIILCINR